MTRSTITPLNQIDRRMAEAGRIRMGEKTAKAMTYLERFRFTSADRHLIEQIGVLYGGTIEAWHEPKASPSNQWQIKIEADKINVILPYDALDQWYELWAGSGCVRRCDGELCETPMPGPDGFDLVTVPCMCAANKLLECKPYTRLKVILPGVDLHGVWRLETKGWNALHELPGMVDLIHEMTTRGRIVQAQMSIAKVERMVNRRKSHFIVPKIVLPFTPEQLVAGNANLSALTTGPSVQQEVPALTAGPGPEPIGVVDVDDADGDVQEAEIVTAEELAVRDCATQYGVDPGRLYSALHAQCSDDPERDALERLRVAIAKMQGGDLQPTGFDANGRVVWT